MARTRGYQPKASRPAKLPNQDQTNRQPQVVTAIFTPGDLSMTPEQHAAIAEDLRVAAAQPSPEEDDFPDDSRAKPYDPNGSMCEGTKAEAWNRGKINEEKAIRRNRNPSNVSSEQFTGVKDEAKSQWNITNNGFKDYDGNVHEQSGSALLPQLGMTRQRATGNWLYFILFPCCFLFVYLVNGLHHSCS